MKILKKCLTCGAEFIASKMSNKYCCRECERDASRKREAKRKKSVRESEKEAALDKEREFSEIELSIIERIFSICVNLLREPWENVIKVTPRLERIETNSQFAQIISPTETIAIITINLKIGEVEGLVLSLIHI